MRFLLFVALLAVLAGILGYSLSLTPLVMITVIAGLFILLIWISVMDTNSGVLGLGMLVALAIICFLGIMWVTTLLVKLF